MHLRKESWQREMCGIPQECLLGKAGIREREVKSNKIKGQFQENLRRAHIQGEHCRNKRELRVSMR